MDPKHTASIIACARWETRYITEWLLYHQSIGFDHVYLYCNDDDPAELYGEVLPFCRGQRPFVTFHHFPYQGQQFYMMMHGLQHHKDESEWIAFLDIDEFLVLPGLDNIKAFLHRCPLQWDSIQFNWSFFGHNFHAERPSGSVLRTYTRREGQLHPSTKTLTRSASIDLSKIDRKILLWHSWEGVFGDAFVTVNVLGEPENSVRGSDAGVSYLKSGETQARIRSTGLINHYAFKSERDVELRIARGTLGDFRTQLGWQRVTDAGSMPSQLARLNAIEDTYLADYWRRFLRAADAARIVPVVQLPNIALGKRADQSSHSKWSRGATRQDDAAGAISGIITGDAQCHTDLEHQPWWMVDLGLPHFIYEVHVYNRVNQPALRQRLGAFRIEVAAADGNWTPIHVHDGSSLIGGADGHPLVLRLGSPVAASRLRLIALGHTCLHLDQVEVYGVSVTDEEETATRAQDARQLDPVTQPDLAPPSPVLPSPVATERVIGRIALSELLKLAHREPALLNEFLSVQVVHASGRYTRPAPACLDLDDALPHVRITHADYMGRLEQSYPATFHVALRDATVSGQGSVITAGNALLIDSCWEFFAQDRTPPGLASLGDGHYRLEQPPVRHIDRPSLLVKRPFWRNYGHWLMDGAALLTMLATMDLPQDCQIIIGPHESPKMRNIMQETLDILAPGRSVLEQPDNETWTFAALHYVTPPQSPPLTKQPAAMAALAAQILEDPPPPGAGRRLFVPRDTRDGRALVNEREVIALCTRLGFEVVRPEQYSLREQAALFRSAACVVGVKGAAFTNVLFCAAGAGLFVLSPADWPDPIFWDLASQLHVAYGEMFGSLVGVAGRQSTNPFTIDVQRLERHLTAFCQRGVGEPIMPATAQA